MSSLTPYGIHSGEVGVHNIVKSDISPLGDRFASRNANGDVLEVRVAGEFGEPQGLIESRLGGVREAESGRLGAVDVETHNGEGAALCEAGGAAGVGAEAVVEAGEVERRDAWTPHELHVRVQGEVTQLEKVDRASGASLLWGRVWYDRSRSWGLVAGVHESDGKINK